MRNSEAAGLGQLVPAISVLSTTMSLSVSLTRARAETKTVAAPAKIDSGMVSDSAPRVSALVAAWNESDTIDDHLKSFLRLSYPDIELIVCAGGDDETFQRALRYQSDRVHVIEQFPGEGKQHALARAFEHASGDVIYLTDADCLFSDAALTSLIAPIIAGSESASSGTSHPLDHQANSLVAMHIWARDLASSRSNGDYIEGMLGRNAAVNRNALETIGGLDFDAPTGTDYQLAKRLIAAGIRVRHVPQSSVASRYPESIGEYRRKQSRWLRNLVMYGPKFGAHDDVFATGRTIALGWVMLTLPLFGILLHRAFWFVWAAMLTYASLARIRQMSSASQHVQRPSSWRYPLFVAGLAMIDFAVTALPLLDLLSERRRRSW